MVARWQGTGTPPPSMRPRPGAERHRLPAAERLEHAVDQEVGPPKREWFQATSSVWTTLVPGRASAMRLAHVDFPAELRPSMPTTTAPLPVACPRPKRAAAKSRMGCARHG